MADQLPASQTAPIDEFRILWTSQKKQKLKKWQDGFLRFHTYNKRMIVYDETRTLVCDMYLQRADKVNTGDEFEFEHHLVTVEEFKGRVIQDLSALISPIVERRQHRQLQVTHKQHPLYPERGVRLQAPAQDSPLSAQQAMHPPALPRQIGGVGNAEHVSLTEILKRSAGQERSSSTSIRTPVRRDASAALFRSGTTLATSGSDIRGEEIPTRSVTIMKPPVRAKQGSIRPIQPPEGILDMTPPLCCAQSTRNITTIAGHGTTTSRMRSTTFHHEASSIEGPPELPIENSNTSQFGSESWLDTPTTPQAPNVTAAGNDVSRSQIRSSIGVISSKSASTPSQIPRRTPFNPLIRSIPTVSPALGRFHSPSPQAALIGGGGVQQPEEVVLVSHGQTAYKRPNFTIPRTLTADGAEDSVDVIMDDPLSSATESDQLVPKGRKRVLENLPTTTIKLGTTKRKMLLCRGTIQWERPSESGLTTGELTVDPEAGNLRRRSLVDSAIMAQGAEDLLLGDTILAERRGLEMDKVVSITASTKVSAEITEGFAVNRPGIFRRDGSGGGHDGQETSEINTSVGMHSDSKSSAPDPPLGSSVHQAPGVEHSAIVSDRIPRHKEKGKGKTEERTEKGTAHAIGANIVALDGCLAELEGLGNNGGAASNKSGDSPTPPHHVLRRWERKKREQIKKAEGAELEGNTNNNSREFGPWSMEAFDLIAWRPPNLVG